MKNDKRFRARRRRRPRSDIGNLRLSSLLSVILVALGPQVAAGNIADLAYDVRIVRYAATGNAADIPGDDDTPAHRQTWLNDIAAALGEASGFFYKPIPASGGPSDQTSPPFWAYQAIDLTVHANPVTENDISATLAKVTWIVRPQQDVYFSRKNTVRLVGYNWSYGYSWDEAVQIAVNGDVWYHNPMYEVDENGAPLQDFNYYRSIGMAECYQDYTGWCYHIEMGPAGEGGKWVAPGPGIVNPVPGSGGGSPPPAWADGWYLAALGGMAAPGAFWRGYDTSWTFNDPPSACVPPEPSCPGNSYYALSGTNYIYKDVCHAHIIPPTLPTFCPLPSYPSYSYTGGMGDSCPSCGSPVWHLNKEDLSVTVTDTPIWINPVKGPKLAVRMTFHPEHVGESGDFGWGWRWDFAMKVSDYGPDVKIVDPGAGRGSWWFISNGDGTWDGPPSAGMTLEQTGGGFTMTKLETGETWTFDADGKLLSWADRFGHTATIAYDADGRIQTITDAAGATLTFARDDGGRVITVTESTAGRSASFTYDEDGFLVKVVDMGGVACGYEYGHVHEQQNPDKNYFGPITKIRKNLTENGADDTTFEYSVSQTDRQQELKVTDPEGAVTTYRWDHGDTEVFTTIDPNGAMTSELYETIGNRVVLTSKIDALENEWTYEYDASGFLVKETDPLGNVTTWTRNTLGNPLTVTRPGGATTTYTYAENGVDLLSETDLLGNTTTYEYDENRNLVKITDPVGRVTTYTYDDQGRKTSETLPSGLTVSYSYDGAGRLESKADSLGAITTWTYDARGLVASKTTPDGLTVQYTYDALDRLLSTTYVAPDPADNTTVTQTWGCCNVESRTDRHGATTTYAYDKNGRLLNITDALGNTTSYEYDAAGNRIKTTDALGNVTTTAYDLLGRPTTITYPDGTTESFEYDALGRQTRRTDRAGRAHIVEYDVRGNVTARKIEVAGDPDPVTYTLETAQYDLADRRTSSTNASGLTVTYAYDAAGRITAETYPDQTTVSYTYDNRGMTARTDRLGHTTSYTYDEAGRILTVTDPLGNTTAYTYNAAGRRTTLTDALGNQTTFEYDQEGRLIKTTYPDGAIETRTYAPDGLLVSQTDRAGVTTSFEYDALGRRTVTKVAGNTAQTVTYDALGRIASTTDARGVTVTNTYDAMGRLIRRTMPDATHEDFTYGPDGMLTKTDRASHTTSYTYDALGRRASQTNPNNETISFEYDLAGRMTRLTDSKGNITTWTYDAEGRMTRKTYADGSHYDYTYDAAGHLLTRTDAKGKTTSYTYDAAGRLTKIDYPDDPDITYTRDALGRKTSVTDATGTTAWTYDAAGRIASVDGPFDHDTITVQTDGAGRYACLAVDNRTIAAYTYDDQGRLHTVTGGTPLPDGAQPVFTYTYDGPSRFITRLDMPNGLHTDKTWDSLNRLASVVNARNDDAISSFNITTDDADRRIRIDLADGGRWEYTYDNAGQLTGGTRYGPKLDNTEGTLVQYSYQYDAIGNPVQRSEDSGVSTYTYNNLNQLVTGSWSGTLSVFGWTQTENLDHVQVETGTQSKTADVFQQGEWTAKQFDVPAGDNVFTVTRVATDQTTTQRQTTVTRPADQTQYEHDANGNLLGDGQWTYTWNNENRLITAEIPQQKRLEFVYDHHGRRRIKKVFSWDAQAQQWTLERETHFIWLDWLLLETRDVTHNRRTDYILGTDLSGSFQGAGGIGGILASVTTDANGNTSHQCFLYDFNGNVVNLADPVTGDTTATYEYSPFGKLLISYGPSCDSNPIRFSTKQQDETGLYYYGYRYYDANVGRWKRRDVLGEGLTPNLYAAFSAEPLNTIDAIGLLDIDSDTCPKAMCQPNAVLKLETECTQVASSLDNKITLNTLFGPMTLRSCVLKLCSGKNSDYHSLGTVSCGSCAECLKSKDALAWTYSGSQGKIYICPKLIANSPFSLAKVVVHEFAHVCGWDHEPGMGVPDWPRDPSSGQIDWEVACAIYGKKYPWICEKVKKEKAKNTSDLK